MYPDVASGTIKHLENGTYPRERLHGYFQLKQLGWDVSISDSRWTGRSGKIRRRFRKFFHLPSIGMLRDWKDADVIVVKDNFSLILTLQAKSLGKRIVYLDSMFLLPKRKIRALLNKRNILLADAVICFSETQADLWSQIYSIDRSMFKVLRYSMDCDFYKAGANASGARESDVPIIVSVGRDPGRDFASLISAISPTKSKLKLVTLPYLLPDNCDASVEVLQNLSYDELFALYRSASVAVVPLVSNVTYPSGIRAVMEAMLLGVPVVATWTPVLAEYFTDGEDLLFVKPDSPVALRESIDRIISDPVLAAHLRQNALRTMEETYRVEDYGKALAEVLMAAARQS
jgi:glycosyltransferase involved in cell wall biosynthesis